MGRRAKQVPLRGIAKRITDIRDQWHTKKHPFFREFGKGDLPIRAMGLYMAQHYQFVSLVLPNLGYMFVKAPTDVRNALIENLSEEAGLDAIDREGHKPHDHMLDIFRFTRAAGLTDKQVKALKPTPAWWARTLHYCRTVQDEPIGVVLAMQATQEGQQVALNIEVTLPAFTKHYGYPKGSPAIAFFEEHAAADEEHSSRQIGLCAKYLDTPALQARAIQVAEQACMLRWSSISDLYRSEVLKERPILPRGMAA